MNLLRLHNVPIFEQLQIEEALLRVDQKNWCLINTGSPEAIIMGISGKLEKLINADLVKQHQIPLIRRFSGGGTVFVDEETLFVTFIGNASDLEVPPQSRAILNWTENFYRPLFPAAFSVKENDYVLGEKKFGGNAHYLQKNRWLHHSTLLWEFEPKKMDYLLLPEKRPTYRRDRSHKEFLCTLRPHFKDKDEWIDSLIALLRTKYSVTEVGFSNVSSILSQPHRKATEKLSLS